MVMGQMTLSPTEKCGIGVGLK